MLPVAAQIVGPHSREGGSPLVELLGQELHQPRDPLVVITHDDGADIAERLQQRQTTTGEVKAVDVHRAGPWGDGGGDRQRPQCRGLARAAGAVVDDVARLVGTKHLGMLGLLRRHIHHAEHDAGVPALPQLHQVVDLGQRVQPWLAGLRYPAELRGCGHATHHPVDVLVHLFTLELRPGQFPGGVQTEIELVDVNGRGRRLSGCPGPGESRLEPDQPSWTHLRDAPAGGRGVDRGCLRTAQHVGGVVLVIHAQCHPQVGVRSQAVLDDAGGALRGEHQV